MCFADVAVKAGLSEQQGIEVTAAHHDTQTEPYVPDVRFVHREHPSLYPGEVQVSENLTHGTAHCYLSEQNAKLVGCRRSMEAAAYVVSDGRRVVPV
jgi:hypothetical protein